MKFKVSKSDIMDGLHKVQGVVSTRSTLPILSNVLLEARDDKLWLTTTDLEVSMRCSVKADISEEGASTFPAKRFFSVVRELPDDDIEVSVGDKDEASIKCRSAFFKIVGLPAEDFPTIKTLGKGFHYTVEQTAFREMLKKTVYAVSTDETRFVLNGILMSFKGDKLTMVATDGRRLALVEDEVEIPDEAEIDMIVPTKAVQTIMNVLGEEGGLKIQTKENQVSFEFGDISLVSKLIDGTYPNFRQVIPSQCEERAVIERESMLNAVKRVALLTTDKTNSVKLSFADNKLEVSASTPDVGEARESIPIKYTGKKITVAFNPEFVIDPLRNLSNDEVFMELTDDLSPGVLKCDMPFLYVLMPMRIN
jgi:DNA polymerase-3 subunit beta